MYRTLKRNSLGEFAGACPECRQFTRLDADLNVIEKCPHFVRRWRVSADGRVRAQFQDGETAAATPAVR